MAGKTIDQIIAEDALENLADVQLEKSAEHAQYGSDDVDSLIDELEKTASYIEKTANSQEEDMIFENTPLEDIEKQAFWRRQKTLLGSKNLGKGWEKTKGAVSKGWKSTKETVKKHPKKIVAGTAAGGLLAGGGYYGGKKKGRSETRGMLPEAYEKGLRRGFQAGMRYKRGQ